MKQTIVVLGMFFSLMANSVANAEDVSPPFNGDDDKRTTFVHADVDLVIHAESMLPELDVVLSQPFTPKSIGAIVAFGHLAEEGSKVYAGPGLLLGPLTIGAGIGVEARRNFYRAGAIAMLDTEKFTAHAVADVGSSDFWWMAEALWHPRKFIGFGAMAEKDDGYGPRVEIIPLGKIFSFHWGFMKPDWSKPGYTSLIGFRLQTE